MDQINLPKTITVDPGVMVQQVEDEIVLLHAGTEEYFSLDDIGSTMWKLLCDQHRVEDVVTALLEIYDVEEEKLRYDLAIFIGKLAEEKLITMKDE